MTKCVKRFLKLAAEIGNNEEAKDNLKRIKAIHHRE
jgi:hypothetical protein